MAILVGTDFSENSFSALRYASQLAKERAVALYVLHVVDVSNQDNAWRVLVQTPDEMEKDAVVDANQRIVEVYEKAVPVENRVESISFDAVLDNPIDGLLAKATAVDAELIVVGTLGASRLREILLGSTANQLVRQSGIPVALIPPSTKPLSDIKRVLAPVDFSEGSERSLHFALQMAKQHNAKLDVLYAFVLPEFTSLQTSMGNVAAQLQKVVASKAQEVEDYFKLSSHSDVDYAVKVLQLPPHLAIVDYATQNSVDAICLGTHGRRGWARFFLGNTAEKVMRHTPCPIFVIGKDS